MTQRTTTPTPGDAPRLNDMLDDVWQRISRGVADRHAAARHPVLATVGAGGGAEARVVVLRAADRAAGMLTVHTDAASAKVAELEADPQATLLVWDMRARLQIRLRCQVRLRPGTDQEWDRVPDPSRRAYGGTPPPGTPIAAPDAYVAEADRARFMVLEAEVQEIDVLHLGTDRHTRATFSRTSGWAGRWCAP